MIKRAKPTIELLYGCPPLFRSYIVLDLYAKELISYNAIVEILKNHAVVTINSRSNKDESASQEK